MGWAGCEEIKRKKKRERGLVGCVGGLLGCRLEEKKKEKKEERNGNKKIEKGIK